MLFRSDRQCTGARYGQFRTPRLAHRGRAPLRTGYRSQSALDPLALRLHQVEVRDLESTIARPASGDGRIKAPIPGLITRVLVSPGEPVEIGQPLMVLEAMKMENEIRAPRSGRVTQINVAAGQSVALGMVIAEVE